MSPASEYEISFPQIKILKSDQKLKWHCLKLQSVSGTLLLHIIFAMEILKSEQKLMALSRITVNGTLLLQIIHFYQDPPEQARAEIMLAHLTN